MLKKTLMILYICHGLITVAQTGSRTTFIAGQVKPANKVIPLKGIPYASICISNDFHEILGTFKTNDTGYFEVTLELNKNEIALFLEVSARSPRVVLTSDSSGTYFKSETPLGYYNASEMILLKRPTARDTLQKIFYLQACENNGQYGIYFYFGDTAFMRHKYDPDTLLYCISELLRKNHRKLLVTGYADVCEMQRSSSQEKKAKKLASERAKKVRRDLIRKYHLKGKYLVIKAQVVRGIRKDMDASYPPYKVTFSLISN
jgi:hypothetical protein